MATTHAICVMSSLLGQAALVVEKPFPAFTTDKLFSMATRCSHRMN
jgi:hypothetical protein